MWAMKIEDAVKVAHSNFDELYDLSKCNGSRDEMISYAQQACRTLAEEYKVATQTLAAIRAEFNKENIP